MKRLTAYALTAAAALATAGTIPSTANAAVHTYNFSAGGGKVIMVTGNNGMDFNHILNQIPGFHASRRRSFRHRIFRTTACLHRGFRTTVCRRPTSRLMKIRMRP